LFRSNRSPKEENSEEASINQGVYYLYLIVLLQVFFLFGILAVIVVFGQVLVTPLWAFMLAFGLAAWGCIFIYRKAKKKFNELRKTFREVDFSDKNLEISIMGGMLTMRLEHTSRPLLEAPSNAVLDAETVAPQTPQ
jgi:glucan phosphoethanolaminetransferase (alkaline phosphatase superfamily)